MKASNTFSKISPTFLLVPKFCPNAACINMTARQGVKAVSFELFRANRITPLKQMQTLLCLTDMLHLHVQGAIVKWNLGSENILADLIKQGL